MASAVGGPLEKVGSPLLQTFRTNSDGVVGTFFVIVVVELMGVPLSVFPE